MQAVILVGIQGSGKTTFYRERLFDTHVRLSLDLLRTRPRLQALMTACLAVQQPFVIDNTNVTRAERAVYITAAKAAGFRVIGYYFQTGLRAALGRNARRSGKAVIPVPGVIGTLKRLEPPVMDEGFDELHTVTVGENHAFVMNGP